MRWLAVLTLGGLLVISTLFAGEGRAEDGITAPYDQELYELSYEVFLANSKPDEALGVAERALARQPRHRGWLRRAAQAADWSNAPEKALRYWFALAPRDEAATSRATQLARSLNDLPRLKVLIGYQLDRHDDPALLLEYIRLAEETGRPDEALRRLQRPAASWPQTLVLEQQFRLLDHSGYPLEALAVLDKLAALRPLTAAEALRGAGLWAGVGQPEQAWELLQRTAPHVDFLENFFWEGVSDLGWGLGHEDTAGNASKILVDNGVGRFQDYQRLVELWREENPEAGYETALAGWQRHRHPYLLLVALDTGISLGRWEQLERTLNGLSPEERASVEELAIYWQYRAQIARQQGDIESARRYSLEALRREPANEAIMASHLWLLLDLGAVGEATRLADEWGTSAESSSFLQETLGAVYLAAGEPLRALDFYGAALARQRDNPFWLASYADVLEQAGYHRASTQARLTAMRILHRQGEQPWNVAEQKERERLLAQLGLLMKPGDAHDALMRHLVEDRHAADRDLVTGWLLSRGWPDQARLWFLRAYVRSTKKPGWAELELALQNNDRPAMASLLSRTPEGLPVPAAVEANRRLGQLPQAETLAFEHFQRHEQDSLFDAQVRDMFDARRSEVSYGLSILEQDGAVFVENRLAAAARVKERWTALAEAFRIEQPAAEAGKLANPPDAATGFRLGTSRRHRDGKWTLLGGRTDAVYAFWTLAFSAEQTVSSRLTLNVNLALGTQAEENVPLRVGGLKDEATLEAFWSLASRTGLGGRLSLLSLRDQDRRSLAEGSGVDIELTHRLAVAWPDLGLRLFGGYHDYGRAGLPQGRTLALVPVGADPGSFFVPESYAQFGAGLFFGQDWKLSYTRDWKTFGAADSRWNSVSGMGYRYELGAVGPLFGLDALQIDFSQDSGSFGRSDVTTQFMLSYRLYF
ncbi:tetratricopeptide repeat protein [Desulfuromonas sp. KJ2020]|uniref:tetratricopeptide repeat protein n=1 Tax=Desulfuromonas sp. KJ2020 TaxID=2919173 RepID=UPI0020A7CC5C|nr:tetratricopeptide repeat protein [Desulfuromonas sp. KJ2020]MCP3176794.1 tetratricopeptide repeat protein [Desulfuromonas sp. KJ2020]